MLCVNIMGELGLRLTSDELIRVQDTADRNVTWWTGVGHCGSEWDYLQTGVGTQWTGVELWRPKWDSAH